MFLCRKNNLVFARFSNLSAYPGIFHGIFTRSCGKGAESGLDTGANNGHDRSGPESAAEVIAKCLGASELIFLNQNHGTKICIINTPRDAESTTRPPADAIISQQPGSGLAIKTADCQPVMLYDPVKGAAANIHAGWRGSISNIIGKCITAMRENFKTDPADLAAGIGPSLGPCCGQFVNYREEIPEAFWTYKDEQNRFNFWQASMDQLKSAGVREKNIELAHICTVCNPHLFFSYRGEKTISRFAAVIGLTGNRP
ncbi:MAG: peptidoglycan editing factor PgeF [Desulfobacteraceae bacterium]|nr:peptidoglycan editing factor PgeF [Desulfobacteraceae bacterium]